MRRESAAGKLLEHPVGLRGRNIAVNRIGMGTLDRRPNGTPFCGTTVSARPGGAGRVSAARSGAADWLCGFSFETDS